MRTDEVKERLVKAGGTNKWRIIVWRKSYDAQHGILTRDHLHIEEGYFSPLELGLKQQELLNQYRDSVIDLDSILIEVQCLHHRSALMRKRP